MFAAAGVPDRLSYDFSLPGQEGYETSVKLQEAYGTTYYPSAVPVFTAPEGQTIEQHRDDVDRGHERAPEDPRHPGDRLRHHR